MPSLLPELPGSIHLGSPVHSTLKIAEKRTGEERRGERREEERRGEERRGEERRGEERRGEERRGEERRGEERRGEGRRGENLITFSFLFENSWHTLLSRSSQTCSVCCKCPELHLIRWG
eukprot:764722-Hanusia_phi.AAC.1